MSEGRTDSALSQMRQAVAREDATEKNVVTPGRLSPAREMLADMLMQLGRPAEALIEYQRTLDKERNRYRSLTGGVRAAKEVGDKPAEKVFRAKLNALKVR